MTNTGADPVAQAPASPGGPGSVIWPLLLLPLFVTAFLAGGSDRAGKRSPEENAGASADCEQPAGASLTALEQCLTVQPDDVELLLDLGAAYESMRRWEDAGRVYARALRVDPREGAAHLGLGRIHLARGDVPAARREGTAALATLPGNPAALRLAAVGAVP